MREIALLIQTRVRAVRNEVRSFGLADVPAGGASLLVFGGFAVAVYFLSRGTTLYLLDHLQVGLSLVHRLLSLVLYVLFIAINLGNAMVCYATLFKSDEVGFLSAMPVRHDRILLVKFLDTFAASSLTLALATAAVYFGYASVFGFPWHFYLTSILFVLLPLTVLAAVTAVGVQIVLVAIASRLGIRRLLGLTILFYAGALYLYFRWTNPAQLLTAVTKRFPVVTAFYETTDPAFVKFLPSHWVAGYLYHAALGEEARAYAYLLTLFGVAVCAFWLFWQMAGRLYYRSWLAASQTQPASGRFFGKAWMPAFLGFQRHSFGTRLTDVVLKRDVWLFLRDPGQWVHLLLLGGLLGLFQMSSGSLLEQGKQPMVQAASFLTMLLFNGFLLASVAVRFVFPAVSLEGDAFWCLRTGPVDLRSLYRRKFLWSFGALLIAAEIMAACTAGTAGQQFLLALTGTVSLGCVAMTMVSLHLGAGAVFAQYREKNPIRVASSGGATLTFFLSMVYLTAVTVILAVPVYKTFERIGQAGEVAASWFYAPLAAVITLSYIVTTASSMAGVRRFCKDT